MNEAGLEEVKAYVLKRQNTAVQYISVQPIMDLCEEVAGRTGEWLKKSGGNRRG